MNSLAIIYPWGSVLVGGLLIADNIMLIRKKGVPDTEPDGKATGWTSFFMLAEVFWMGASLMVLLQGLVRPLIPTLYLIFAGIALLSGVIENLTKGPVRSFQLWYVRLNLVFALVFAAAAIYELVPLLSASAV